MHNFEARAEGSNKPLFWALAPCPKLVCPYILIHVIPKCCTLHSYVTLVSAFFVWQYIGEDILRKL